MNLSYALDFKSSREKKYYELWRLFERGGDHRVRKNVEGKLNAALILSRCSKMHDGANYMNNAIEFW